MAKRNTPGNKRRDYGAEVLKDEYNDVIGRGIENAAAGIGVDVEMKRQSGDLKARSNKMDELGRGYGRSASSEEKAARMYAEHAARPGAAQLDRAALNRMKGAQKNALEAASKSKSAFMKADRLWNAGFDRNFYGAVADATMQIVNAGMVGDALLKLNRSKNEINAIKPKIDAAKAKNAALQAKRKGGK